MKRNIQPSWWLVAGVLVAQMTISGIVFAGHGEESETINVDENNVAIGGYDTVAYFTESRAIEGTNEYEYTGRDAQWHFANDQHRSLFVSDPEKYAPQYGSFCALGVTLNNAFPVDPKAWTIVKGKLYLNYDTERRDIWRMAQEENIEKANLVWMEHKTPE
jgi:hypothetical protein